MSLRIEKQTNDLIESLFNKSRNFKRKTNDTQLLAIRYAGQARGINRAHLLIG